MEENHLSRFLHAWQEFFPGAGMPLGLWYTSKPGSLPVAPPPKGHRCVVCDLRSLREPLALASSSLGCQGAQRYLGFSGSLRPDFEYFLSCGIPGRLEGERYKKSPELVRQMVAELPPWEAPGTHLVASPLDQVPAGALPEVVVFFAIPDVLSGLFTLANYHRADPFGVIAPMGSGCSALVYFPYRELKGQDPRAVLGMFDVSARPCVEASELSLAVPWPLFTLMTDHAPESFLVTKAWDKMRDRIRRHLECELR